MTSRPSLRRRASRGFTLIELMVGLALGFFVILVVTTVFTNATSQRRDMERTGRQIENGRYAMQLLADDIVNAGYFGEFDPRVVGPPGVKPDPCSPNLADMKNMVMMHVQGYAAADAKPACILAYVRAGTAAIAIRRTETCTPTGPGANCDAPVAGRIYLQSSLCNAELANPAIDTHYVVKASPNPAFTLHQHDCATVAPLREYVMHIYFVADNNDPGDGVPTLKRADWDPTIGDFKIVPLVEGIENLQFEYGLDNDANSTPDALNADPGTYNGCAADPCYIANWVNTMTVKVHLLSRSLDASPGYTDTKTYQLGPVTVVPINDGLKRHAYTGTIRMNNPAGRREG